MRHNGKGEELAKVLKGQQEGRVKRRKVRDERKKEGRQRYWEILGKAEGEKEKDVRKVKGENLKIRKETTKRKGKVVGIN